MPIYKPSELLAFLHSLGVRPNRRLSQNFLVDGNVLYKIVGIANVQPDDLIVEIGPGPGALTEKLLSCGCDVLAIEKDPVFANSLPRLSSDRLTVFSADALSFDLRKVVKKKAKVIANLPYHITTPLIQKFIAHSDILDSCTLMIQDDAARRFIAQKGANEFGFFSLFLQYYTKPSIAFSVSSKSFYPKPKVGSSILSLTFEKRYPVDDEKLFFSLIERAFSQRRKMVKSSLSEIIPSQKIEEALVSIGKKDTIRPEELCLEEWVQFVSKIT